VKFHQGGVDGWLATRVFNPALRLGQTISGKGNFWLAQRAIGTGLLLLAAGVFLGWGFGFGVFMCLGWGLGCLGEIVEIRQLEEEVGAGGETMPAEAVVRCERLRRVRLLQVTLLSVGALFISFDILGGEWLDLAGDAGMTLGLLLMAAGGYWATDLVPLGMGVRERVRAWLRAGRRAPAAAVA
jgi:hypothetical protein